MSFTFIYLIMLNGLLEEKNKCFSMGLSNLLLHICLGGILFFWQPVFGAYCNYEPVRLSHGNRLDQ